MWNGICPVCARTEVYGRTYGVVTNHGGGLVVGPQRIGFHDQIALSALICGACGHVALQVAAADLGVLHEIFQREGWAHVPPVEHE